MGAGGRPGLVRRLRRRPRRPVARAAPGAGDVPRHAVVVTDVEWLDVGPGHLTVSSTAARAGRREWMAPEAAAFDAATGAWSDPDRYARWRSARPAAPDRHR